MARLEAQEKEIEALKKSKGGGSGTPNSGGAPGAKKNGKGGRRNRGRGGRGGRADSQGGAIPAGVVAKLNKTCHPWNAGKSNKTVSIHEFQIFIFQELVQSPAHHQRNTPVRTSRTRGGFAGVITDWTSTSAQCSPPAHINEASLCDFNT